MRRKGFKDIELKATELSKNVLNKNIDEFYLSLCHSCEIRNDHIK